MELNSGARICRTSQPTRHDHRRRSHPRAHSRARAGHALGDGRGQRRCGDGRKRTANWRRQRAILRRSHPESRRHPAGGAAKIFRRARNDARGIENGRVACSVAGRQVPHLVHASRTKQSVRAVFVGGSHARSFRTRDRSGAHICFLRRCEAADGQEPHQRRQPRKRDRRARGSCIKQGTITLPRRIRPAQNS